jgi:DNA-binding NtrC family response regulator
MGDPRYPDAPVLILDDDRISRNRLELVLAESGIINTVSSEDPDFAADLVRNRKVELVLVNLSIHPAGSGPALVEDFIRISPQVPVIVIADAVSGEAVKRCMRAGAADYIALPIDEIHLRFSVWNALGGIEIKREVVALRTRIRGGTVQHPEVFEKIVTRNERMIELFIYIEAIAKSRQPVLLTGETGTGKELFAKAVHDASGRTGPFVAVNLGGLDDTVFADTLFGHRKGSYTGAESARGGLLREASGGTIFLDEIADLEPRSQVKLLRLLQDGEYYPLGSDASVRSGARVIAASARDLSAASRSGSFRADLFYRLQIHPILIPPLRSRKNDIPLLIGHFLEKSARVLDVPVPHVTQEQIDAFCAYDFPGNVRELESLIHDFVAGADIRIPGWAEPGLSIGEGGSPSCGEPMPDRPVPSRPETDPRLVPDRPGVEPIMVTGSVLPTLEEAEAALIRIAIGRNEGNVMAAARALGISRQTLYKKLKEMGREPL